MKLTTEQLRKIIISEMEISSDGNLAVADDAITNLIDMYADKWHSAYDPSDPVQSEYGQQAWEEQVVNALDELENQITTSINRIERMLMDGAFADSSF